MRGVCEPCCATCCLRCGALVCGMQGSVAAPPHQGGRGQQAIARWRGRCLERRIALLARISEYAHARRGVSDGDVYRMDVGDRSRLVQSASFRGRGAAQWNAVLLFYGDEKLQRVQQ